VRRLAGPPAHQRVLPAVNLRPDGDHPDRALVVADLDRHAPYAVTSWLADQENST
jgi:hypothetical protein